MKLTAAATALAFTLVAFTLTPARGQTLAPGSAGLANPASVFCEQCGGTVAITATPGGQTGLCVLPFGLVVEEWALWRMFFGGGLN